MPTGENKATQTPPTKGEKTSKTKRISSEYARLMKSFADLPEDKLRVAEGLVREAAYMRVTLEDWKKDLDATGWTELFSQSEKVDPYEKKKAKAEMYLNMNPNYQKIIDKLISYLPKSDGGEGGEDDGFESFIRNK